MDKPSPNYSGKMVIPTFTVTINPMEEDEVTYDMVPPSTAHPRYAHSHTFIVFMGVAVIVHQKGVLVTIPVSTQPADGEWQPQSAPIGLCW